MGLVLRMSMPRCRKRREVLNLPARQMSAGPGRLETTVLFFIFWNASADRYRVGSLGPSCFLWGAFAVGASSLFVRPSGMFAGLKWTTALTATFGFFQRCRFPLMFRLHL